MIRYCVFLILFLVSMSWSGFSVEQSEPVKICGTPDILQADLISRMDKMKTDNPVEYQRFVEINSDMIRSAVARLS